MVIYMISQIAGFGKNFREIFRITIKNLIFEANVKHALIFHMLGDIICKVIRELSKHPQ